MASATIESRIEMGERVIINIKMFADGHKPPDRVILALDEDRAPAAGLGSR
jgi:glyoxylate reductase